MTHENLIGKTVVFTGGAGILGQTIVKALAEYGLNVAVCDLNKFNIDKNNLKGKIYNFECDVLDIKSIKSVANKIIDTFGCIDFLINGAGGNSSLATTPQEFYELDSDDESFFTLSPENMKKVMDLNFFGTVLPSQVFTPYILKNKNGCIINFSSMNAYVPLTKIPMYSAGKSAVTNFTQWLATYLSHTGIRVNGIAPGFFDTIQTRQLWYNEQGDMLPRAKRILDQTPWQRFGIPKELIGVLFFLLNHEHSGFITGSIIPIDGGFLSYAGV